MQLLTKSQTAAADALEAIRVAANHLANAAFSVNRVIGLVVALDDDALAQFAVSLDVASLEQAVSAVGSKILDAVAAANEILEASGARPAVASIDSRPVTERLEAQYRRLEFKDGIAQIVNLERPKPPPVEVEVEPGKTE